MGCGLGCCVIGAICGGLDEVNVVDVSDVVGIVAICSVAGAFCCVVGIVVYCWVVTMVSGL